MMRRVGKANAERSEAKACPPAALMVGTARDAIIRAHRRSQRLCPLCGFFGV